jgi:excisionase family DNA binding protein
MTSRSGRGRWQRVIDALRQARESLGQDPNRANLFDEPAKKKTTVNVSLPPLIVEPHRDESVRVLSLGEAAARLGVSRPELEAMIAAGKIEALPTGYTRMIPTREVDRLMRAIPDQLGSVRADMAPSRLGTGRPSCGARRCLGWWATFC